MVQLSFGFEGGNVAFGLDLEPGRQAKQENRKPRNIGKRNLTQTTQKDAKEISVAGLGEAGMYFPDLQNWAPKNCLGVKNGPKIRKTRPKTRKTG